MKEYGTKTFGELNAERYDAFYEDAMAAETHDSVEMLAELAGDGKVLELAIGTGRVALPLAARGLSLHGIEASEAMVSKLREKPGGSAIPVEIGDMAEVRVKDTFDLIYLVFNTIFNLTTQEAQVRCFQNAAEEEDAVLLKIGNAKAGLRQDPLIVTTAAAIHGEFPEEIGDGHGADR